MGAAVKRKTELSFLIENYIANNSQNCNVSDGTLRYFQSFLLLLKKEEKLRILKFLCAYSDLLKKKRIPFFSLNTVIRLYERWKNYPSVIRDLKLVSSRIKKSGLQEDFWCMLIRLSGADGNMKGHENRLTLLVCIINNNILDQADLCNNHSIIQSILNCNVRDKDLGILRSNLREEDDAPYWNFFDHIRHMKKNGASPVEISEMIRLHHDSLSFEVRATSENRAFIEVLYRRLPGNFMTSLYYHQVEKLRFVHCYKPDLFDEWQPEIRQRVSLRELILSLFRNFVVSTVFVEMFVRGELTSNEKQWFAHVLCGNNLVTAEGLPINLTRRAAHIFRCMDGHQLSVTRAIVFSGIEAQVNDENYSRRVVNSIHDLQESEFWIKTMAILHKNGLPSQHVTEVMDYIGHKVFVERVQLDIKHKKISNLLNDIDNWHRQLNEASLKRKLNRRLPDAGIEDRKIEFNGSEYEITQIRKMIDLYEEGKEMHHCVYTYAGRCMNRSSYIFSLRMIENEEVKTPLITIELRGSQIVQAKGKYNRRPDETEKNVIQIWANEMQLRVVA